jgi:hypothetical protein
MNANGFHKLKITRGFPPKFKAGDEVQINMLANAEPGDYILIPKQLPGGRIDLPMGEIKKMTGRTDRDIFGFKIVWQQREF